MSTFKYIWKIIKRPKKSGCCKCEITASNSFVYFNGEFDVETLNESETFPVIISSNGKSSIFNFHTTRILEQFAKRLLGNN